MVGAAWIEGRHRLPLQAVSAAKSALSVRFQTACGKKGKCLENSKLGSEPLTHMCATQSADLGKHLCWGCSAAHS